MQLSSGGPKPFNKCGYGGMVNGKSQRYASRGLNETVVHIAEQINSVCGGRGGAQTAIKTFLHTKCVFLPFSGRSLGESPTSESK